MRDKCRSDCFYSTDGQPTVASADARMLGSNFPEDTGLACSRLSDGGEALHVAFMSKDKVPLSTRRHRISLPLPQYTPSQASDQSKVSRRLASTSDLIGRAARPPSDGGLLLHRHRPPLKRRSMACFAPALIPPYRNGIEARKRPSRSAAIMPGESRNVSPINSPVHSLSP
jgi:hypothetical protein